MALVVVVMLEAAELLFATVASVVAIASATPEERGTTIALAVTVLLLLVGVVLIGWGLLIGRKHLLGAVLTWQFMEVAVAIGAFEGVIGGPEYWWIGLVLLVPAIVGIALCLIKPVTSVFGRAPKAETEDPVSAAKSGDARAKSGPKPRRR